MANYASVEIGSEESEQLLTAALKSRKRGRPGKSEEDYTPPPSQNNYVALEFADAVEFLYFFDQDLSCGNYKLHKWQIEELKRLSASGYTKAIPQKYNLVAANGSGKDAFIIAVIAMFKLLCRVRARTIITSSSNTQLKLQTENFILQLAERINSRLLAIGFKKPCVKTKKFPVTHLTCPAQYDEEDPLKLKFGTGSEIVLFTTDETGRAEGWHPHKDKQDAEVTLIINEAKTVPDFIFDAFGRCTYTHFLCVSSPGRSNGRFYYNYLRSKRYPDVEVRGEWYSRKITSYDCPHIAKQKIDSDKEEWGEGSFIFRSRHLAEFTNLDELIVIKQQNIDACLAADVKKHVIGIGKHAGIDLALGGGDEVSVFVFDENIFSYSASFFCPEPGALVPLLDAHLQQGGLEKGKSVINCDDGNIGPMVIDALRKLGWQVNKILNQSKAINSQVFLNRGAELYFNFGRMIQECLVKLPTEDARLITQLANRYYSDSGHQGKLYLESKKDAKARGQSSPDRADCCVLAFAGWTAQDFKIANVVENLNNYIGTSTLDLAKQRSLPKELQWFINERNKELRREHKGTKSFGFNPTGILRNIYGRNH